MFLQTCERLRFPSESIPVLQEGMERICTLADAELQKACDELMTVGSGDYLQWMQALSEKSGVHQYTADMVTLLYAVDRLVEAYKDHRLPEQLMWDSLDDLRCKVLECKAVHDIWGTFVTPWFPRFYWLQRFKLGRLEYEKDEYAWDIPIEGIRKGDPVINIHIPSSGPLTPMSVEDSLAQAWAFYRNEFSTDRIPFVCHSWLLYPPVCQRVFPEHSNLRAFCGQFEIVGSEKDEKNEDFWRIFHMDYSEEALQNAPADTTLQRNMLTYLREGNCMGFGAGVIWYTPGTVEK